MLTRIPWRILAYVAAGLIALAALNHFAGFVPFTPQWQAKRAAAKADRLEGEVSTLEREAAGNAEIATATETFHTRETIIREITAQAETDARTAPDANALLPQERADRLRAHDQRMCDESPFLCSDPDDAAGRPAAVPPSDPAG